MTVIPFQLPTRHPSDAEFQLAKQLRALAARGEDGEIRQLVVTVIRQDGRVERIGSDAEAARKP